MTDREKLDRRYTIRYVLIQALYWAGVCAGMGYTSVFLLDRGYSNSEIGIVVAVANVAAVILQPLVASISDRSEKIPLNISTALICAVAMTASGLLLFLVTRSAVLTAATVLLIALLNTLQPLVNSLYSQYQRQGVDINFGLGRGCGSLAYAIISTVLGILLNTYPTAILPFCSAVLFALLALAAFLFRKPSMPHSAADLAPAQEKVQASSFTQFVRNNKRFMLFMVGVTLMFYFHSIICTYLTQVMFSIGASRSDIGLANSIAAICELPAMIFFTKLVRRVSCSALIRISAVVFALKYLIIILASSSEAIFVGMAFQGGSYAIFIPASVYYVDKTMNRSDAIKGQASVTTAFALGNVLANVIGGWLIDGFGVSVMMQASAAIFTVGAIMVCLFVKKVPKEGRV